ncbi:MAG: response regulator [Halocynthiibacter sp.]
MDDLDAAMMKSAATAERPLLGLTVLVVEDSRFTCEAMRLLCLRSGARMRRADCLASARRHLQVYRPSVVIVDLGLPDGCGEDLISELCAGAPRTSVVLGISGDPDGAASALAAGADGFLAKPVETLAAFQSAVLKRLPAADYPTGPRPSNTDRIRPDPIAFREDLSHISSVLTAGTDAKTLDYVAQFLSGVARSARDTTLQAAAEALARDRAKGLPVRSDLARLAGLVQDRLAAGRAI